MSDTDTIIELGDQLAAMGERLDDLKQQLTAEREARQKAETDAERMRNEMLRIAGLNAEHVGKLKAAEARINASQEQEPHHYWCSDKNRFTDEKLCDYCSPFYEQPIIPPEVEELQRENAELTRKLAEQQTSTFQFREAAQALFDAVDPTNVMSGCECEPEVGYTCAGCQFTNKEEMRNFRKALFKLNTNSEEFTKLLEEAKRQAVPEGWKLVPIEPKDKT